MPEAEPRGERRHEGDVAPDYVEPDQGTGQPMLLVGDATNAGDVLRVLDYLQERYDVELEHAGEHQRAYTIHPDVGGDD